MSPLEWAVLYVAVFFVGFLPGFVMGYMLSHRRIRELKDILLQKELAKEEANSAQRFRIRTAESDPSQTAKVRTARVRAYKSVTPPPRKGKPKTS